VTGRSSAAVSRHAGAGPAESPSQRLRLQISLVTPFFGRACERVFRHPRIREVLPEYLIDVHAIIRSTTPLMEAGIRRAEELESNDPVAAGVAEYLRRHVEEERFHDDWLLEDLAVMGVDTAAALERLPSDTIATVAGVQYYWTLHYHPVALLGYFAFAEGFPPSTALVEELIERTGYPRRAFRTFVEHGELDPGHLQELDRAIDQLPLERRHEQALGLSAITTGRLLTDALNELVDRFDAA
jgi:hypothetical protein